MLDTRNINYTHRTFCKRFSLNKEFKAPSPIGEGVGGEASALNESPDSVLDRNINYTLDSFAGGKV